MKRYECRHCKFLYTRKDNRDRHEIKCNGGQRKRKRGAGGNHEYASGVWNHETVSFDEGLAGSPGSEPTGEHRGLSGMTSGPVNMGGPEPASDVPAAAALTPPRDNAEAASKYVRLEARDGNGDYSLFSIGDGARSPDDALVKSAARDDADTAAVVAADGDDAAVGSPTQKKAKKLDGDDDAMAILLMAASRAPRATESTP